ncbi:M23 family metallopeptidase [Actinomycetes bacterium KLBMP 9797]
MSGSVPATTEVPPVRHRKTTDNTDNPTGTVRYPRRVRYGVPAIVLAAGLGLAGFSYAVTAHGDDAVATATAVAAAQQDRAEAATRADRAERAASPTPSATSGAATPPAGTSPSTSAATPKATPVAPKAKPAAPKKTVTKKAPAWVNPLPGAQITSCYGMRWGVLHAGIDFAAPAGTPIRAVGAGTVVAAGWAYSGYGISVVVNHGNGYLTHYAHQSRVAVRVGQKVGAGQVIGYEGSTGDSTGPHLHFEVHQGTLWSQVNPAGWLKAHGVPVSC